MSVQFFDLTSQVDGVNDTFSISALTTSKKADGHNFLPLLNGQKVNLDRVTDIDTESFTLLDVPKATDTVAVMYQDEIVGVTFTFEEATRFSNEVVGKIRTINNVKGTIKTLNQLKGSVSSIHKVKGIVTVS